MRDDTNGSTEGHLGKFRAWFYAAALYNVAWGVGVILFPNLIFELVGMPPPNYLSLFQCIGMMVLVYGLGYYLLARDPIRYAHFVWIGLAGKTFGPVGFLWAALQGDLPWVFGWTVLFNDIVWWPAFWMFALKHARHRLK
ncbi:MAG: hypothetical protein KF784_12095 [Fimbriimonadaceae bacterium]|nr:hypothetical protein [Fimbriimonadaceae bacterium]